MDDVGSKIRPLLPYFFLVIIFSIFLLEEHAIVLSHCITYKIHLLEVEESAALTEHCYWDTVCSSQIRLRRKLDMKFEMRH